MRRAISAEVKQDLLVWCDMLDSLPEKRFKKLRPEYYDFPPLRTDESASMGFGALWGEQWFVGRWPETKMASIATLELYSIFLALSLSCIEDATIQIGTDNDALITVLNKINCKDLGL